MKVRELIEALEQCDPEKEVKVDWHEVKSDTIERVEIRRFLGHKKYDSEVYLKVHTVY